MLRYWADGKHGLGIENAAHGLMTGRWHRDTFNQEVEQSDNPRDYARLGPIREAAEAASAGALFRCTYNPETDKPKSTQELYGLPASPGKMLVGLVTVVLVARLTG